MVQVQKDEYPRASLAVNLKRAGLVSIVERFTRQMVSLGQRSMAKYVICVETTPTLSVATGIGQETLLTGCSERTMALAGQVTSGGVVSVTLTVKLCVFILPAASLVKQKTVVMPTEKRVEL